MIEEDQIEDLDLLEGLGQGLGLIKDQDQDPELHLQEVLVI